MSKNFSDLGISDPLVKSLTEAGFVTPTEVQELTIPTIVEGKDIFAQAETGSGKTGAFVIPLLEVMLQNGFDNKKIQAVILSPTRELAVQTFKVFQTFADSLGLKAASIIGGESFDKQKEILGNGVDVIISTPGRLVDLVKQKNINLSECKFVVFDEADRLFEMGFKKDIEFVLNKTPEGRQLIMVSATGNMDVLNTAYKFHSQPIEVRLNKDDLLVDNINHQLALVTSNEKMPLLVNILRANPGVSTFIFSNTQIYTHTIAIWLEKMGFKARPISGKLPQNQRSALMEGFRAEKFNILVCTDVAARGLDIKDVKIVINFDLPLEAANYVHRIGRTGRAGKDGKAISFCAHEDAECLDAITELLGESIPKMDLENDDFATDVVPKPRVDFKTLKEFSNSSREKRPDSSNKRKTQTNDKYKKTEQKDQRPQRSNTNKTTTLQAKPDVKMERIKHYEHASYSLELAKKQALNHFAIKDEKLLGHEVLEQGKKKYFLFGPRMSKYKFYLKPLYNKLLLPFVLKIVKTIGLDVYVKISFKKPFVKLEFSGKDSDMLMANNKELVYAIEYLSRNYLYNKINVPRGVKLQAYVKGPKRNDHHQKDFSKQEKELETLAQKMMDKAKNDLSPSIITKLNSKERRVIHQYVTDDSNFSTESIGDGAIKSVKISYASH